MTLARFVPGTDIERLIAEAREGGCSPDALILALADSTLFVPSTSAVQSDGRGFSPVLLEQDGVPFAAVFTAPARQPQGMARYRMQTGAKAFFLRLPPGYGVIVNPGYDAQVLLPPDGIAQLKRDLAKGP